VLESELLWSFSIDMVTWQWTQIMLFEMYMVHLSFVFSNKKLTNGCDILVIQEWVTNAKNKGG
jgi:hypothetical protein